jgi:gas vesicle protein
MLRGIVIGGILAAAVAVALRPRRRQNLTAFVNRQFLRQTADWLATRLRI